MTYKNLFILLVRKVMEKFPDPLTTLGDIIGWMQASIACISGSKFCIDNNEGG